jgi:hypothetical protein
LTACGHRISAAADHVVLRHFDDEAAFGGHHRERRILRRDDAGRQTLPKNRVCGLQVRLPEEAVYAHERIFARHAVDDDVDAFVSTPDALKQRPYFLFIGVIDAMGDCGATSGLDH